VADHSVHAVLLHFGLLPRIGFGWRYGVILNERCEVAVPITALLLFVSGETLSYTSTPCSKISSILWTHHSKNVKQLFLWHVYQVGSRHSGCDDKLVDCTHFWLLNSSLRLKLSAQQNETEKIETVLKLIWSVSFRCADSFMVSNLACWVATVTT